MPIRDVYENGFDEECGKTINEDTCPECAGNLVTDGGEISCADCGLITGGKHDLRMSQASA
jgi:transcription initiation factor TFIIB